MNRKRWQILLYLIVDFVASYGAWLLFARISPMLLGDTYRYKPEHFYIAGIIALFWVFTYALAGLYQKPFRKSRLQELSKIFRFTLGAVLVLLFVVLLDDPIPPDIKSFSLTVTTYFACQFGLIFVAHFIITTRTNVRIRKGIIGYPTLLVGCQEQASLIYNELGNRKKSLGFQFKGYVCMGGKEVHPSLPLEQLGLIEDLPALVESMQIEEVIIAMEKTEATAIQQVIGLCEKTESSIKIVPGSYDYIIGSVKISHILGAPLIELFPEIMKPWQWLAKRGMDIIISLIALAILWPVFIVIAIAIKLESKGPIFFRQERIGKGAKPFKIYKFRSMYQNAEKDGPALSSDNDPRITPVGLFLRKLRLDEIPQFLNVLKGEMSIVGPRPERQHYIDLIVQQAPQYQHLHKVRPGITSWGQVKYGYASTVEEMVERLKFDTLYLEQMSLALDIKIMLYTLIVIIEGRGK